MENKEDTEDKVQNPKELLNYMLSDYLANDPLHRKDNKVSEVEMRFGNRHKSVSKIDYDNVAQSLYNNGFVPENPNGFHSLRIIPDFRDRNGVLKRSNIRAEIIGVDLIQEYCKTNSLQKLLDLPSMNYEKLKFTQKSLPKKDEKPILPVQFNDFNMKVSYQLEDSYNARSNIAQAIIRDWDSNKKIFRLLNRVRFVHETLPIYADLSIVKQSKSSNNGKNPIKYFSIQDANLFSCLENYEVEMEIDNSKVGPGTEYNSVDSLVKLIKQTMRFVLSGLQGTNYPISYNEYDKIQHEYMEVIHGENYKKSTVTSKHFIGPSSLPLKLKNVAELDEKLKIPNIRNNYTVTDKADGERCLLFINEDGKIYMINSNMDVIFTGSKTVSKELFNSVLDGEHILFDKNKKYINLFAAFDIYYKNKQSLRENKFYKSEGDEELKEIPVYRLDVLSSFINNLKPQNIANADKSCEFQIICKTFKNGVDNGIFSACNEILTNVSDDTYSYNTDGLIFTPCEKAVGGDESGKPGPLSKFTWSHSLKWKPMEYTTIDFLVTIKKDKSGRDEVHNIFQNGINTSENQNILQYKTLVLRCGYSKEDHGYLNPFNDMINDTFQIFNKDNDNAYKPVPFNPTNPYDENACYANVLLKNMGENMALVSEEGEIFDGNMIVEFKYDINKSDGWRWIPLRVRYDKTAQLLRGLPNYGNAYHVANDTWQVIHSPITSDMMSTGENIPEYIEEEDDENGNTKKKAYYEMTSKDNSNKSRAMRDFHNLFVKRKLIGSVSVRDDTLIDYSVGKAGDLPKWIKSKLKFVFGIDINKDNIHNHNNGACVRYLNQKSEYRDSKNFLSAIFINGDSGMNIRNGAAFNKEFSTEKEKEIANALFGVGPKDPKVIGQNVYNNYGIGEDGYSISSCQFSLHYFFKDLRLLNGFIRNLAECTKLNGYFIGTCYDGKKIFEMLKDKEKDESIILMNGSEKQFEITKMYSQTGFPDDENSLGYSINVFQDSIGAVHNEFLVNFDYFVRIMEDYGFVPLTSEEALNIGLPDGIGNFEELFKQMENEVKINGKLKLEYKKSMFMTSKEKQVSFMNNFFVFRKMRNVAAEKLEKNMLTKNVEDEEIKPINEEGNEEKKEKKVLIKRKKKVVIKK